MGGPGKSRDLVLAADSIAAGAVLEFEQKKIPAAVSLQPSSGSQAGDTAADDDNVGLGRLRGWRELAVAHGVAKRGIAAHDAAGEAALFAMNERSCAGKAEGDGASGKEGPA
jgi:hypothetical protein